MTEPKDKVTGRLRQGTSVTKRAIEAVGRHPFATGFLAILAVVGFLISVVGFRLDRGEARATTEQIAEVNTGVSTMVDKFSADCDSPPCWSLAELLTADTLSRPKDLLDRKLPPPERVSNNQYQYVIQNCHVDIEYRNDAVSYISSDITRTVQDDDGTYRRERCPFEPERLLANWGPQAPSPGRDDQAVTIADALGDGRSEVSIANACIECGNYAEPYAEFFMSGSHASGFVDLYFEVTYNDAPEGVDDYEAWKALEANLTELVEDKDEYYTVEAADLCGKDIRDQIRPIGAYGLSSIGIGRGDRVWAGPAVFKCR